MRICLFDDRRTADLGPLTLTRPASDLLCGLTSLGEKQTRYFGAGVVGRVCRPVLADWLQARDPFTPANDPDWLRSGPTILVNSRWLAPSQPTRLAGAEVIGNGPAIGMCVGEVAYAVLDTRHLRAQKVSPRPNDTRPFESGECPHHRPRAHPDWAVGCVGNHHRVHSGRRMEEELIRGPDQSEPGWLGTGPGRLADRFKVDADLIWVVVDEFPRVADHFAAGFVGRK